MSQEYYCETVKDNGTKPDLTEEEHSFRELTKKRQLYIISIYSICASVTPEGGNIFVNAKHTES